MAFFSWFDSELFPNAWFEPELNKEAWFDSELIPSAGGPTVIDLTLASLSFTKPTQQLRIATSLATKAMASWVPQALTWSNAALGTVIDLTLASFGFLAKTLQTATRTTTTLASLAVLGKALQPKVAASLALKAMSSWLPKATQPAVRVSLALRAMSSWLAKTMQTAIEVALTKASIYFQAKILSYVDGVVPVALARIRLNMARFRRALRRRDY